MNDHPTPTDEDLSAAIDGLADDDLLARIAANPELSARLGELRTAAARVGGAAVPPLDEETVDHLIAGALDAPLAPARGRNPGRRGAAPWLVAAAVVLLMALGLTLIWAGQGAESDRAASTSASTSALDKSSAEVATGGASGGGFAAATSSTIVGQMSGRSTGAAGADATSPPTTMAPAAASSWATAQYLGSYADGAALRKATASSLDDARKASEVDQSTATTSNATVPTSKAVDRCAEQLQVTLSLKAPPTASAWATVDGKPVLVYEFATTSAATGKATTLVAAVGVDACEQVVIFER